MGLLLAVMPGCAPKPLIRVDIDTYLKNQAQYKDKNVVIVTSLKDVMAHYDLYREKTLSCPPLLPITEKACPGPGT